MLLVPKGFLDGYRLELPGPRREWQYRYSRYVRA